MKKTIFIFTVLLLARLLFPVTDLQLGARPQAMGGAYTALSGDANSVYWNPAGLAGSKHGEFQFMHWMIPDVDHIIVDYLAFSYPVSAGALGFAWVREGATLEEGINADETSMSENQLYFSYGLELVKGLSAGASLKRFTISSDIGDGSGFGFDAGVLYQPFEAHKWTVAATGKNLLADMKDEMIKPSYNFGTSYSVAFSENMHNITVALDLSTKEDINETEGVTVKFATGLEYAFLYSDYSFALRGGLNSNAATAGFGIGWNYLAFDYAIVLMNEDTIGDSHKFGIVWKFRQSVSE